jgi:hypothetical protein
MIYFSHKLATWAGINKKGMFLLHVDMHVVAYLGSLPRCLTIMVGSGWCLRRQLGPLSGVIGSSVPRYQNWKLSLSSNLGQYHFCHVWLGKEVTNDTEI